jgi:branched-chain amino acid transport system substrate-binding protein
VLSFAAAIADKQHTGTTMRKRLLAALPLAAVILAAPAMAQEVAVGAAGPMTGGQATFGRQLADGAEQAVADINAAGGILGKKLKLELGDDACDPKQARSVAEKLSEDGVAVVVGHYCSSSSIPASDAYLDGGILQITPASTSPLFTERGMWNTFRTCGRDDQQGGFAASYLAKNFKNKNIAIINDKTTYGRGLADETKRALNAAGVTEKLNESYNQGDKDFTALVSKLKLNAIDVVYDGGYHQEAGLIVRQMRDQGLTTILMAGDALASHEFASITGAAGDGVLFTFPPDPRKRPSAAALVKKFKDKGVDPEGYVLYTYAAYQVWAEAAAKAGSTDPQAVAAAMHGGSWDTVLGPISFDKKGDITADGWAVYRWDKNGNYEQITDGGPS